MGKTHLNSIIYSYCIIPPEKYKMIFCPSCEGTGKSSNGDEVAKVCSQCGGFGWVKKEGDDK
jgi:hypothetical protein